MPKKAQLIETATTDLRSFMALQILFTTEYVLKIFFFWVCLVIVVQNKKKIGNGSLLSIKCTDKDLAVMSSNWAVCLRDKQIVSLNVLRMSSTYCPSC